MVDYRYIRKIAGTVENEVSECAQGLVLIMESKLAMVRPNNDLLQGRSLIQGESKLHWFAKHFLLNIQLGMPDGPTSSLGNRHQWLKHILVICCTRKKLKT